MSDLENLYREVLLDHSRAAGGPAATSAASPSRTTSSTPRAATRSPSGMSLGADGTIDAIAWEGAGLQHLDGVGVDA